MPQAADDNEVSLEILKALDDAIAKGPWDKSPFLIATGKKLKELRQQFVRELNLDTLTHLQASKTKEHMVLKEGMIEVYVSLYTAGGSHLQKWETLLNSLSGHSVNRPTYRHEKDIQSALRAKGNQVNDAYAVVHIPANMVIHETDEEVPMDRHGNELLVIKEGAIKVESIKCFVHSSGKYKFINKVLVRKES